MSYNDRLESNLEILKLLETFLKDNPDMRFCQALWCLDIIRHNHDNFSQESTKTLELIKNGLNLC